MILKHWKNRVWQTQAAWHLAPTTSIWWSITEARINPELQCWHLPSKPEYKSVFVCTPIRLRSLAVCVCTHGCTCVCKKLSKGSVLNFGSTFHNFLVICWVYCICNIGTILDLRGRIRIKMYARYKTHRMGSVSQTHWALKSCFNVECGEQVMAQPNKWNQFPSRASHSREAVNLRIPWESVCESK